MRQIYSQAVQVVIWLGPKRLPRFYFAAAVRILRLGNKAMTWLSARADKVCPPIRLYYDARVYWRCRVAIHDLVQFSSTKLLVSAVLALYPGLCKRFVVLKDMRTSTSRHIPPVKYLRRAWIQQEMALAQDKKMFLGSHLITWEDLNHVITALMHLPAAPGEPRSITPSALWDNFNTPETLRDAIGEFWDTDRSVSHDSVYAFLGFSRNGTSFPVNYDSTLLELLLETSLFCIRESLVFENKPYVSTWFRSRSRRSGLKTTDRLAETMQLVSQLSSERQVTSFGLDFCGGPTMREVFLVRSEQCLRIYSPESWALEYDAIALQGRQEQSRSTDNSDFSVLSPHILLAHLPYVLDMLTKVGASHIAAYRDGTFNDCQDIILLRKDVADNARFVLICHINVMASIWYDELSYLREGEAEILSSHYGDGGLFGLTLVEETSTRNHIVFPDMILYGPDSIPILSKTTVDRVLLQNLRLYTTDLRPLVTFAGLPRNPHIRRAAMDLL